MAAKKANKTAKKSGKVTKKTEAKKVKKEVKSKIPQRKRQALSMCLPKEKLTKEAKALIAKADSLEVTMADAQDAFAETLQKIAVAAGGSSFEHPQRGPMSIMIRHNKNTGGETCFWRVKPHGKKG